MAYHFGRRVIGDRQFEREQKRVKAAAHHFGKRVVKYQEPEKEPQEKPKAEQQGTVTVRDIRRLTAPKALEYLAAVTDRKQLVALHEYERGNPDYPGGRSTILNFIEERLGESQVRDPHRQAAVTQDEEPLEEDENEGDQQPAEGESGAT